MDIKETQNRLLELVKNFDEVCEKNNVNYTLHGGSLLGAVREKGFIAWDDDIDVAILREEYDKLVDALVGNDDYYIDGSIKKQFKKKKDGSVWVDLFICDRISEKKLSQKIKLALLSALDIMNRDSESIKLSNLNNYGLVKRMVYKIIYCFGKIFTKNYVVKKYKYISEKSLVGKKSMMLRSNDQYVGRKKIFPAEWMEEYIKVKFEDTNLQVIKYNHEMLVSSYGENYMTPVKENRNAEIHDILRTKEGIKL